MATQSTAILTFTHEFTVMPVDSNGVNQLAQPVILETRSVKPKKTRQKIDMTNALSNGLAEWAPGVLQGQFSIAGVVDAGVAFDAVFSTCMDNAFLSNCVFYLIKPTGLNNPITYSGLVMWEDAEMDWTVEAGGKIAMWQATGLIVGGLVKGGTDLTGAVIRGYVQN